MLNYIHDCRLFSQKIISYSLYLPCFLCRMISSNATITTMSDNIIIMHIASIDANIAIKAAVLLPSIDPMESELKYAVCIYQAF